MAQYKVGNVTVKNNSATVWGASCDFVTASNVKIGDLFKVKDLNAWYQVSAVNLATNLNISPAYAGSNASNVDYLIARDFTTNMDLPEITAGDLDWPDVYTRAMRLLDAELFEVNVATVNANHTIVASQDVVLGSGNITFTLPRAVNRQRIYLGNRSVGTVKILASSPPDYIASGPTLVASINLATKFGTTTLIGDGGTVYYQF